MRVLLFGATGMVGRAALLECLDDPDVTHVLAVGRRRVDLDHPKLQQLVTADLFDLRPHADVLTGWDACLFCLGVSSVGMPADDYRHVTFDLTVAIGTLLAERNPSMPLLYVSGAGTDSSEQGRTRWARVKGATENALFALPLTAYAIRPGIIRARRGVSSRTGFYNALYRVVGWLTVPIKKVAPTTVIDSDELGRAMLVIARTVPAQRVWEMRDLVELGRGQGG